MSIKKNYTFYTVKFKQESADFDPDMCTLEQVKFRRLSDQVAPSFVGLSKHRIALRVRYHPESEGKAVGIARAEVICQYLISHGIERSRIDPPVYPEYPKLARCEGQSQDFNDFMRESEVEFYNPFNSPRYPCFNPGSRRKIFLGVILLVLGGFVEIANVHASGTSNIPIMLFSVPAILSGSGILLLALRKKAKT